MEQHLTNLLTQKGYEPTEHTEDERTITFTLTHSFEWTYENFCVAVEDVMDEEEFEKLKEEDFRRMWNSCLRKNADGVKMEVDDIPYELVKKTFYPQMDEFAEEEIEELKKEKTK